MSDATTEQNICTLQYLDIGQQGNIHEEVARQLELCGDLWPASDRDRVVVDDRSVRVHK